MINFENETIINKIIAVIENGANVDGVLEVIERHAHTSGIDLGAAPHLSVDLEGHGYCAFSNWTQCLYAGVKHHAAFISKNGYSGPFIDYAVMDEINFGLSAFMTRSQDGAEVDAYDMTTCRDNKHVDWVSWVRGAEELIMGIELWRGHEDAGKETTFTKQFF